MNRKQFIQRSLAGMATLAAASSPFGLSSCAKKVQEKAVTKGTKTGEVLLNLSFQENTAPFESLNEKLDYMEKMGIVGFEPWGRGLAGRVQEIQDALKNRSIKVSAICAGFDGFILAEDPKVKAQFDASMREIVAAAGELGSTGVIMVPAFNSQKPCKPHTLETRDYLCEQLHELGEYAVKCGTNVILEPLNREEAFYMRLVADAAAIARDAQSEGVKCMGDFWHMREETSDYGALWSGGKYLQHIHIASRGHRIMPGEDGDLDNYVDGFRALKEMGYSKYVSFECGSKGDKNVTLPSAVELLRTQWEQA